MSTKSNILIALLITIFAVGCKTAVQKSDFHADYGRLHQGKFIKGFWASPQLDRHSVSGVFVESIDTSRTQPQEKVPATNAVFWLKNSLQDHLKSQPPCGLATEEPESTAKLTVAITFLTPGSASGRRWAGELGAGHAIVQVEGKLIDSKTGTELADFAEHRRDSGAIGFEDMEGDASAGIVRRLLVNIGDDFVKELAGGIKN